MMRGGITVVGCVTGTHIIEDINVPVPHKIAVYIPADQVLRSKDLHRGLQQKRIWKLDGGSGLRSDTQPLPPQKAASDAARIARLEAENKRLRRELQESQTRETGLHQVLSSLGGQLSGIQGALGRLEGQNLQPIIQQVVAAPGTPTAPALEVVGGEAPSFMPDQIAPEGVEASIRVKTEESAQSNVSDARTKLRQMRQEASES